MRHIQDQDSSLWSSEDEFNVLNRDEVESVISQWSILFDSLSDNAPLVYSQKKDIGEIMGTDIAHINNEWVTFMLHEIQLFEELVTYWELSWRDQEWLTRYLSHFSDEKMKSIKTLVAEISHVFAVLPEDIQISPQYDNPKVKSLVHAIKDTKVSQLLLLEVARDYIDAERYNILDLLSIKPVADLPEREGNVRKRYASYSLKSMKLFDRFFFKRSLTWFDPDRLKKNTRSLGHQKRKQLFAIANELNELNDDEDYTDKINKMYNGYRLSDLVDMMSQDEGNRSEDELFEESKESKANRSAVKMVQEFKHQYPWLDSELFIQISDEVSSRLANGKMSYGEVKSEIIQEYQDEFEEIEFVQVEEMIGAMSEFDHEKNEDMKQLEKFISSRKEQLSKMSEWPIQELIEYLEECFVGSKSIEELSQLILDNKRHELMNPSEAFDLEVPEEE